VCVCNVCEVCVKCRQRKRRAHRVCVCGGGGGGAGGALDRRLACACVHTYSDTEHLYSTVGHMYCALNYAQASKESKHGIFTDWPRPLGIARSNCQKKKYRGENYLIFFFCCGA
jgi:hypothetical protein